MANKLPDGMVELSNEEKERFARVQNALLDNNFYHHVPDPSKFINNHNIADELHDSFPEYEDTFIKELADDIANQVNTHTAEQFESLKKQLCENDINASREGKRSFVLNVLVLIVGSLTLIATILFGLLQVLQ